MKMIYHYTSINALALILKYRTLRFNCLNNVDDMAEGQTDDYGDISNHLFVSCWTEDCRENIALWNMYTPRMAGVRIGLPCDMLDIDLSNREFLRNAIITGKDSGEKILLRMHLGKLPLNVKYYSKASYPRVLIENSPLANNQKLPIVQLDRLGLIKLNQWDFQKECRFVLGAALYEGDKQNYLYSAFPGDIINSIFKHKSIDILYIDIPLRNNIFSKMEVLIGPSCNKGDQVIVESVIRTSLPKRKIRIENSALTGVRQLSL